MTGEAASGYRVAFRAAPQALLAVDGTGVVRLTSVEAERLLRRSGTELIGRRLDELLTGDPTEALRSAPAQSGPAAGQDSNVAGVPAACVPGACRSAGASAARPPPEPVLATSALRLPDGRQVPVDVRMSTAQASGTPADPGVRGWVVLAVDDPGETVRSRAALEHRVQRLADAEQEQESLLGDLIRAQERERARIAAGVHDDSLQVIAAAMLRLQQLRRRLRDPDALEMLARLEESIALAADRLRRLIFDLRPLALERSGLAAAVRDALSRLRDDAGIEVRLNNRLDAEPPLPTRLLLYRIVQEALANVGKHAAADLVEVTLANRDDGYLVRVADDGVGSSVGKRPHPPEPGHLGLALMRERAEFAGGWFRMESARASGTTVTVWVPHGADVEPPPRPPALRGVGVRDRASTR
jgi:signal transduction histidine kinase